MSVRGHGGAVAAGGRPGGSPLANFTKLKKLGEGGFGKVFLVLDKRDSVQYVMKEVDLTKLDAKGRKEAVKECAFLARMSHPNIISYREWFEVAGSPAPQAGPWAPAAWKGAVPKASTSAATLYLVMSYADGGDLESRIKQQQALCRNGRFVPFPEQQIVDWIIQTALAIKHIHDRKILHRDIKCANIFLTKLNLVKLGDFGIARDLSSTMAKAMTQIGTPFSLSPELVSEKPYDAKSDIWALGIVLYELMCLRHPFNGATMKELISNIIHANYAPPPAGVYSKPLVDLMTFLLQKNPKHRPTINQLLRFPFIQQHIGRFLSQHKIQEEFSHTVLHGALAKALPSQQPLPAAVAPRPQLVNPAQAQLRAQQLHAAQEAENRAREQREHREAQAAAAHHQQHQQQLQQQREAQAAAAAQAQAKAAAIARAKALAVEQAEKARQAHQAAIRAQQERQRAEALEAGRQRAAALAQAQAQRAAREAARERELREAKELQRQRDETNRREAQRRADERARLAAEAKEREREYQRADAAANRALHASPVKDVVQVRRNASAVKKSPLRPPWVGIGESDDAPSSTRVDEDRRLEEERERQRALEERERERMRAQRREHEDRQVSESLAPTLVRPVRPRPEYHDPRDGRPPPPQQQQHVLHRSPSEPASQFESRSEKAAKQAAHEAQLAAARKAYFEERKEMERRRREMRDGSIGVSAARRSSPSSSPSAVVQPAASVPSTAPSSDRRPPSSVRERPAPPRASVPPVKETHEEQLARARREYFEERKALEARRKAMVGEIDVGSGSANSLSVDRNERPLGGGANAMRKVASEAVLDRPPSSAASRRSANRSVASDLSQRAESPPVSSLASANSNALASSVASRRNAKAEAQAAQEAALAKLRLEYFEERKALAARKQAMLDEAAGKSITSTAASSTPATTDVLAPLAAAASSSSSSRPSSGASAASTLAADRAAFFAAHRAASKASALATAASPDVTGHITPIAIISPPKSRESSPVLHAKSPGAHEEFSVHKLASAPGSPQSDEADAENATIDAEETTPPPAAAAEDIDSSTAAAEAEASIEELATNTHSCEQMVQLMQTMRSIMLPAKIDGTGSAEGGDTALEEDEEEYVPPTEREAADDEEESQSDAEDQEEELADTENEEDEPDVEVEDGTTAATTVVTDFEQPMDELAAAPDDENAPATEGESDALTEFNTFRADELREAVASALSASQKGGKLPTVAASAPPPRNLSKAESNEEDDRVGQLTADSSGAPPARSADTKGSTASLYNNSATLPSNKIPIVDGTTPATSNRFASANESSVASASPPATVADVASSSSNFGADPMSYQVESLRLFLSEKLGDDLLLDIYRLLRRTLQTGVHSIEFTDGHSSSVQPSPNTTLATGGLPSSQPSTARESGSGNSSRSHSRRGSITSLVVNDHLNVRELLSGSGLLNSSNTKYISLIQQLIKAEHQLYGQL